MAPRTKKPASKSPSRAAAPKVSPADMIVSSSEMAATLGITTRWLSKLVADYGIPCEGRGRFRIGEVVRAYAAFLKDGSEKKGGSDSLDRLREEKALEIQMNRARKDRTLIALEEAIGVVDDMAGIFVSALVGLPAQITKIPRERQRLNEIFDKQRQRLADRFAERRTALFTGRADIDPAAEDEPDPVGSEP